MASSRQQSAHQSHQSAYQVLNVQQVAAGQIPPKARPQQPPRDQGGLGLGLPQPRHRSVQLQEPGPQRGQEMGPMRLGAQGHTSIRGQPGPRNGQSHGPGDNGQGHNGQRQGSGGTTDPEVKAQVELAMRGLGGLGTRKRGTIIGAIASSGGK